MGGLHQEERAQQWSGDQARCNFENGLPRGELGHVEDAGLRQQAPVLRAWASPGHSAEEFRRRAGLSRRGVKSRARVFLDGLLTDPSYSLLLRVNLACSLKPSSSGGEARQER